MKEKVVHLFKSLSKLLFKKVTCNVVQDYPSTLVTSCFPYSLWAATLSQVTTEPFAHRRSHLPNSPLEGSSGECSCQKCLMEPGIRIHTGRSWLNVSYK